MKRFLMFFVPGRRFWRMLFIMLPAILLGWWLFPVGAMTYFQWIVICLLVSIWDDIQDIRDKLGIK
jgi:hypothetical protein